MAVIIGTVVGKILGVERGIPNATINIPGTRLFPGTTTTTDNNGYFNKDVPDGYAANITINAPNYRQEAKKVPPYNLGKIKLSATGALTGKYIKGKTFEFFLLNFKNLIFAIAVTILAFIFVSPKMPGILSLIAPLGAGLLVFLSSRGKGMLPTIGYTVLFGGMWFLLLWIITAAGAGTLTNIETWLKPVDWLHWLGIPQDYLDAFKQGIRNIFGSLTPTPQPPQAVKTGGYQALDVKFGSKYTTPQYTLPTLYANDDYSLTVSVANLNPSDSGLIIKNFYIQSLDVRKETVTNDADMDNKNGFKLMCGKADVCSKSTKPCDINPQAEEQIFLSFKHGDSCGTLLPLTNVELIPKDKCSASCSWEEDTCACTKQRDENNVTDLCDEEISTDKVEIGFETVFDFKATGSGEFRILEKEENIKLAPNPKIVTSSGPIDITAYFVPDHISNKKDREIKMIVSFSNKGGGRASVTNADLKQPENSPITISGLDGCVEEIKKITYLNDGEEQVAICKIDLSQRTTTAPYQTIPVNVEITYTYYRIESTTLPIVKFTSKDRIDSPGYCP